jgi:hypothetical protein
MFYSLIFETSLFVASYDLQGHGGGIRPRLHIGICPYLCITSREVVSPRTDYNTLCRIARHEGDLSVAQETYPLIPIA